MLNTQRNPGSALPITEAFDEFGFIIDEASWTPELAKQIAIREGVGELNERHWLVINHLREKYQELGAMPGIRSVCRSSGVIKAEVHLLFGRCVNVWKVAGLADPGAEARNYMG